MWVSSSNTYYWKTCWKCESLIFWLSVHTRIEHCPFFSVMNLASKIQSQIQIMTRGECTLYGQVKFLANYPSNFKYLPLHTLNPFLTVQCRPRCANSPANIAAISQLPNANKSYKSYNSLFTYLSDIVPFHRPTCKCDWMRRDEEKGKKGAKRERGESKLEWKNLSAILQQNWLCYIIWISIYPLYIYFVLTFI